MPSKYALPPVFTFNRDGFSHMICPSCFRVAEAAEFLSLSAEHHRSDAFRIFSYSDLTRHRRSFEHVDNMRFARLLDLGYTSSVKRRKGEVTPSSYATATVPLEFSEPLTDADPYLAPRTAYRARLTTLMNQMLRWFRSGDVPAKNYADVLKDSKTRTEFELNRFTQARERITDESLNLTSLRVPLIVSDNHERIIDWKQAEPARVAWQLTADPVNVLLHANIRVTRRHRDSWKKVELVHAMFKRSACDRLVEWATLFMNELDRAALARLESGKNPDPTEVSGDMLHILMVMSVPHTSKHDSALRRDFSVYGSGRARTYLKSQPTTLLLPSRIKL